MKVTHITKDSEKIVPLKQMRGWVDVEGNFDLKKISTLKFPTLLLEDVVHNQRPKIEEFGSNLLIIVKMIDEKLVSHQLSLIIGKDYVFSFHHNPLPKYIKNRIKEIASTPGSIAYLLLDYVVDDYFKVLEKVDDRIEKTEKNLSGELNSNLLHTLKRDIILLRKNIWPIREVIGGLSKQAKFNSKTSAHLRDLHDHVVEIIETIEMFREMVSGIFELQLSMLSNKMNEIMKVLTVISTIFIPLTFLTGLYGMNFKYMPELTLNWSYPALLIFMLSISLGMWLYFRKRSWV